MQNSGNPYDHFGVPTVVNCVGYATRVGGSCPAKTVLDAMRGGNGAFVEMDDLFEAASKLIARCTGAEAGIVTCSASAGLTLSAAACLTGSKVEWMDQLPDTAGLPRNEIIYPKAGLYDYEHPLRASGVRLIEVDYQGPNALKQIETAIGPKTAAVGYPWHHVDEKPSIDKLAELAHRHRLPLIVDAAMSLPPAENLRKFIQEGADLVVFSGGKHLQGPQASGILCGRADLIRSAWVQMVDMDVRPNTWSLGHWIKKGWIKRPPRHGIGRSMKVGKEAIVGLMAALETYERRDFVSELRTWRAIRDEIVVGVSKIPGLIAKPLFPSPTGQPFPVAQIEANSSARGLDMTKLIWALRAQQPKIILAEDDQDAGRAYIYPMCLNSKDARTIITAFKRVVQQHRKP
ncbi:MAG: aminotransferase class V-fold PLP-dependent enzyme [Verrucomicrobia bacterium]|nr:aminotransferase class V-fold PLP-dependent enzyme [Verrucomicrobiota bacterium]